MPQSRPRLFIIGLPPISFIAGDLRHTEIRPEWVARFARLHPELRLQATTLPQPPGQTTLTLDDVLDRFEPLHGEWWGVQRLGAFLASLSPINIARLDALRRGEQVTHATAYRRTRNTKPVWEIRADHISGCLRTARGGSSKQAVVEAGGGNVRVRWMTAMEYARLQGAPTLNLRGSARVKASSR